MCASAASNAQKTILFIGSGSFRDVEVALEAHSKWKGKVTATELRSFNRNSESCPDCTKILQQPTPWQLDSSGRCYMDLENTFAEWTISDESESPQLVMQLPQSAKRHLPENAIYNFTLNFDFSLGFPCMPVSRIELLGVPEEHHAQVISDFELGLTCNERCRRIKKLWDKGVEIILGFDGTKLHESPHPSLQDKSFRHIYWNCPHDGSSFKAQTLPPLIRKVVASAAQVQTKGSRLHVSIPQPKVPFDQSSFFQGYVYDLVNATKEYYTLYKKRKAGKERYPTYEHETTREGKVAPSANRMREFVFIRKESSSDLSTARIGRKIFYGSLREFYIQTTDDEYSSESDGE